MEVLKQRILTEGKNLGKGILKVDRFINHQVDPILIKSELPSEDELGAFGVEGTQNAEKDGDG